MNHAVTRGRWQVIGSVPLSQEERSVPIRFFKQDALTGDLTIYWEGPEPGEVHEVPATREECMGLERAAVWEPEHVEDRLRDHFAGRPNKWLESLALK
jgi:hypothetical protein